MEEDLLRRKNGGICDGRKDAPATCELPRSLYGCLRLRHRARITEERIDHRHFLTTETRAIIRALILLSLREKWSAAHHVRRFPLHFPEPEKKRNSQRQTERERV